MDLNPYTACFGDCGKKLKYCSPNLLGELDKIDRMIEGEQFAAALAHLKTSLAKHPDSCSLLGLQILVQANLSQWDELQQTVALLAAKHPTSAIALGFQTLQHIRQDQPLEAIARLQDIFTNERPDFPPVVPQAVRAAGMQLLSHGYLAAARAHLLAYINLTQGQDSKPLGYLASMLQAPDIPLLLREEAPVLPAAPDGVPWKGAYDAGVQDAERLAWRKAEAQLAALTERWPREPKLWRPLAMLRSWLGDLEGTVAALRKFAALEVPHDDAAEAEAIAQLLDRNATVEQVDVLQVTQSLADAETLDTALLSDRRFVVSSLDELEIPAQEDEPPPRRVALLLSGPQPGSGIGLTLEQVPHIVGSIFIYGRQTDREPRIELTCQRPELAYCWQALRELSPDLPAKPGGMEVLSQILPQVRVLSWKWRLPDDTPLETRRSLLTAKRRAVMLEDWPNVKLASIGARTPREAADDPAARIPLLATILLLEMSPVSDSDVFDFNELRQSLQLPTAEPIDPTDPNISSSLSLTRVMRIIAEKLSDEQLLELFQGASGLRYHEGLVKLAAEIARRGNLGGNRFAGTEELADAYMVLADDDETLEGTKAHLAQARTITDALGKSSAPADLAELTYCLYHGDAVGAQTLIRHIQQRHIKEPGVGEQLVQILYQAGIIDESGRPVGPPPEAVAAAADAPGQLWTPGGESASSSSKLWVPGSD